MTPFERKRRAAGLTQTELAAKLGVTYRAVGKWEDGSKNPAPCRYKKLAAIFKMTPEELTHMFDSDTQLVRKSTKHSTRARAVSL